MPQYTNLQASAQNFLTFGRELADPANVAMGNPTVDRLSVNDYADHLVTSLHEAYCDAGSTPARGCCVPTPTQRAIPPGSVNEYLTDPGGMAR